MTTPPNSTPNTILFKPRPLTNTCKYHHVYSLHTGIQTVEYIHVLITLPLLELQFPTLAVNNSSTQQPCTSTNTATIPQCVTARVVATIPPTQSRQMSRQAYLHQQGWMNAQCELHKQSWVQTEMFKFHTKQTAWSPLQCLVC